MYLYLDELLQKTYITDSPPTEDEIVLLPAGFKPSIDSSIVLKKSDFEAILMGARASEPASEAVLVTIGKAGSAGQTETGLSPRVWDLLCNQQSVINRYILLCNEATANALDALSEEGGTEQEGASNGAQGMDESGDLVLGAPPETDEEGALGSDLDTFGQELSSDLDTPGSGNQEPAQSDEAPTSRNTPKRVPNTVKYAIPGSDGMNLYQDTVTKFKAYAPEDGDEEVTELEDYLSSISSQAGSSAPEIPEEDEESGAEPTVGGASDFAFNLGATGEESVSSNAGEESEEGFNFGAFGQDGDTGLGSFGQSAQEGAVQGLGAFGQVEEQVLGFGEVPAGEVEQKDAEEGAAPLQDTEESERSAGMEPPSGAFEFGDFGVGEPASEKSEGGMPAGSPDAFGGFDLGETGEGPEGLPVEGDGETAPGGAQAEVPDERCSAPLNEELHDAPAQDMSESIQEVQSLFDSFFELSKQYGVEVLLAQNNKNPQDFCIELAKEFPVLHGQLDASRNAHQGDWRAIALDLADMLRFEAMQALAVCNEEKARLHCMPIYNILYE